MEEEITQLRDGLKPKVKQLHKMEGVFPDPTHCGFQVRQPFTRYGAGVAEVKGFELKGMTIEDMLNISRAPES